MGHVADIPVGVLANVHWDFTRALPVVSPPLQDIYRPGVLIRQPRSKTIQTKHRTEQNRAILSINGNSLYIHNYRIVSIAAVMYVLEYIIHIGIA